MPHPKRVINGIRTSVATDKREPNESQMWNVETRPHSLRKFGGGLKQGSLAIWVRDHTEISGPYLPHHQRFLAAKSMNVPALSPPRAGWAFTCQAVAWK